MLITYHVLRGLPIVISVHPPPARLLRGIGDSLDNDSDLQPAGPVVFGDPYIQAT